MCDGNSIITTPPSPLRKAFFVFLISHSPMNSISTTAPEKSVTHLQPIEGLDDTDQVTLEIGILTDGYIELPSPLLHSAERIRLNSLDALRKHLSSLAPKQCERQIAAIHAKTRNGAAAVLPHGETSKNS